MLAVRPRLLAAERGDRAHALVVAGQRAGDGELPAAARAGSGLFRRRRFHRNLHAAAFDGFRFFFFLGQVAAAAGEHARHHGGRRSGWIAAFLLLEAAGRFKFGVALGFLIGLKARFLFRLALFGGVAFALELFVLDGRGVWRLPRRDGAPLLRRISRRSARAAARLFRRR